MCWRLPGGGDGGKGHLPELRFPALPCFCFALHFEFTSLLLYLYLAFNFYFF